MNENHEEPKYTVYSDIPRDNGPHLVLKCRNRLRAFWVILAAIGLFCGGIGFGLFISPARAEPEAGFVTAAAYPEAVPQEVPQEVPNLTFITDTGKSVFNLGELKHINADTSFGALRIAVHDEPYIRIDHNTVNIFGPNNGFDPIQRSLTIENQFGSVTIFVPFRHDGAVFEAIDIVGTYGSVTIEGGRNLLYLTENLNISSPFGSILLDNIMISQDFIADADYGSIHLRNVMADNDRTEISAVFGSILAE